MTTEPFYTGRDENRADKELGEILRHVTDLERKASIPVVDANRARTALLQAYAETNGLRAAVWKWQRLCRCGCRACVDLAQQSKESERP